MQNKYKHTTQDFSHFCFWLFFGFMVLSEIILRNGKWMISQNSYLQARFCNHLKIFYRILCYVLDSTPLFAKSFGTFDDFAKL